MSKEWKQLSDDIDGAMKEREQKRLMERAIEEAQMQTMDYQDNHYGYGDWRDRLDQPTPHWQRSDNSTTYTNIGVGQSLESTSGYVQEVTPTPLIDNYEAYKLIEVLTEILDEVRSINRKLSKRKKK